jgi:hypothetical protein
MFKNMMHIEQTDCLLIPAILQSQNPAPSQRSKYKFRRVYSVHVMSGPLNSQYKIMTMYDISRFVNSPLDVAVSAVKIKAEFLISGIYPL